MLKIIQFAPRQHILKRVKTEKLVNLRTFLSQAYYCEDVWNQRLNSPLLQKVNVEDLFHELDHRFHKTKQLSAVDVDIFANALQGTSFCEELLDLAHKLRLTADTGNTLDSTSHAVVRFLLQNGKSEELVKVLDDRLNFGLFLDYYTAILLMDTFWKSKEYANGVRVFSQLMLQDELDHPLANDFGLLHCYNYLLNPQGWPEITHPPEPEEEVKIRVKYLRNPYNDEHFDLKDDKKIVGKNLATLCRGKQDPLSESFYIVGLALFGNIEKAKEVCGQTSKPLYKEILDLVPEDSELKQTTNKLETKSVNVGDLLTENLKKSYQKTSENDISKQCKLFEKWENDRLRVMEEQIQRINTANRLQNIEDLKKAIKEKEERLWFFENEEQIDLIIESKNKKHPKRWFGHKKKPKHIDEGYVPPEVQKRLA